MKLIFLIIFILNALTLHADMTTPPKSVEQQYFNAKNLLRDPGFEMGKVTRNWVASGGTYAVYTTPLSGQRNGSWDSSSASQTLTSNGVTVTSGYGLSGKNIAGGCSIRTTSGTATHTLEIFDGTNILSTNTVTSSTTYASVSVNASAPASGTLYLRLKSVAANEPTIEIDDCYFGLADGYNISQVSQATHYGTLRYASTAACAWTSSATSFTAIAADADCPLPTVTGSVTEPSTKVPGLVIQGPGEFLIIMKGGRWITSSAVDGSTSIKLSDGTINSTVDFVVPITNTLGHSENWKTATSFHVTLTGSTPVTLNTYVDTSAGTITLGNTFTGQDGSGLNFSVYKFPTSSQTAFTVDQVAWRVDANISGTSPDLGTADQASYVSITGGSLTMVQNTGSTDVQIPCSTTNAPTGLTCGAGTEDIGVAFTITRSGDYRACVSFSHYAQTGAGGVINTAFQIIETPTNAQTITQEGKSRIMSGTNIADSNSRLPHYICGTFNFSSSGQKVLRLMYEQDVTATVTTNVILADASASLGQRDIHWEVYPINQQSPAPLLVNSVVSASSGVSAIEAANVNCDAGSTITSQHGSWVSSVGNVSAGACAVTLLSRFTATPYCWAVPNAAFASVGLILSVAASSATAISVDCEDDASTACTAYDFNLFCMGAR